MLQISNGCYDLVVGRSGGAAVGAGSLDGWQHAHSMSDCVIAGITQTFNNAIDTQTVACRWGPSRCLDTGQTGPNTASWGSMWVIPGLC